MDLFTITDRGLYCAAGDFHVDPWVPVDRAVITHAHGDHAIAGCGRYLAAADGERVLRARLGRDAPIEAVPYGARVARDGVTVSLHPAGHVLGSAQVRVERGGEVWVVSGDYKTEPDRTCAAFEPQRCHVFITESTFGLPIFRWAPEADVIAEIEAWWRANCERGRASVLYAYALGKAQRVLARIDASIGPIVTHGAVEEINQAYRESGIALAPTLHASAAPRSTPFARALVLAPPVAAGTSWLRRFGPHSSGFASGWMRLRGPRRRRAVDRGFVLSDHADWPALLAAIDATGADRVLVSHGYTAAVAQYLREHGRNAEELPSPPRPSAEPPAATTGSPE